MHRGKTADFHSVENKNFEKLSFSDILKEHLSEGKIDIPEEKNSFSERKTAFSQGNNRFYESEIPSFAWILASTRKSERPIPMKTPYDFYKKPPRPRPTHSMNPSQIEAFSLLKKLVENLDNNFSPTELKRAFRIAALKTHPDRGGSSLEFQRVKKSYEILGTLFKCAQ